MGGGSLLDMMDFAPVARDVAARPCAATIPGETVRALPEQPATATAIIGMRARVLTLQWWSCVDDAIWSVSTAATRPRERTKNGPDPTT